MKELEAIRSDVFQPYNPHKTQEMLATLYGALDTWEIVLDLLQGDWDSIEAEEEDGEQVGDSPVSG